LSSIPIVYEFSVFAWKATSLWRTHWTTVRRCSATTAGAIAIGAQLLGLGKDVSGGLPGVHPPISDVKDDRVNLSGSLNRVSISVGRNPSHVRKAITRHERSSLL
jgi:hypothetical protein